MGHRCRDLSGNEWRLRDDGSVAVRPCGEPAERDGPPLAAEGATIIGVAADFSGFVWAATPSALHRLDPTAAEPAWVKMGRLGVAPLPAGAIASIAASGVARITAAMAHRVQRIVGCAREHRGAEDRHAQRHFWLRRGALEPDILLPRLPQRLRHLQALALHE